MKVSGFTICRNTVKYDYPVVEAITAILPIVDEFIVNVGDSEDATMDAIQSIGSPKIRIITNVWDMARSRDGQVLADQTNIALSHCTGDWAFYVQADEVVHEDTLAPIQEAMTRHLDSPAILGLKVRYVHFFGDYWTVNPWEYHTEIRIVRTGGRALSVGDACGFASAEDGAYLKYAQGRWAWSGGRIFHYGYVKAPTVMMDKTKQMVTWYLDGRPTREAWKFWSIPGLSEVSHPRLFESTEFPFEDAYDIMKNYRGRHPAVMQDRIARAAPLKRWRNRWLTQRFYREVARHGFKG